jgi:hypothetical protein
MDIKHVLSRNPLPPAYDAVRMPKPSTGANPPDPSPEGTYQLGHSGGGSASTSSPHREYPDALPGPTSR